MEGVYLSQRHQKKDDSFKLYAVHNIWVPEEPDPKKRLKKKQVYIGRKHADGTCDFNDNTATYLALLRKTEYERKFYNWQDYKDKQKAEDNGDVQEPEMQAVANCEDKAAGADLLFSKAAEDSGLAKTLDAVFPEESDEILALAEHCASGDARPLYQAAAWSQDQKLPGETTFTEKRISELLSKLTASKITTFYGEWIKNSPVENRLSLDITSVSSYSKGIPDVTFGYNRDKEKLPQVNLLLIVDQKTKLPVWLEQLPGAIADMSTVKDTVKLLTQLGVRRNFVCDRGFCSHENLACLQKNGFKFTMGVPLFRFPEYTEILNEAKAKNEFNDAGISVEMFGGAGVFQTQGVTKLIDLNGHRAYLHLYYCSAYRGSNEADLMERVDQVKCLLEEGKELKTALDQEIAERCFTTRKYKDKIIARCDKDAVAKMKEEFGGYFAIISNDIKDFREAMKVYKLRDGVEKRFDDLKNDMDCSRLRVHSAERMRARLFIQFVAEVLRCWILNQRQTRAEEWKKLKLTPKTVNDIIWAMSSLRHLHIEGHHPFYKRPTKTQIGIMKFFKIDTSNRLSWPSLHPSAR